MALATCKIPLWNVHSVIEHKSISLCLRPSGLDKINRHRKPLNPDGGLGISEDLILTDRWLIGLWDVWHCFVGINERLIEKLDRKQRKQALLFQRWRFRSAQMGTKGPEKGLISKLPLLFHEIQTFGCLGVPLPPEKCLVCDSTQRE